MRCFPLILPLLLVVPAVLAQDKDAQAAPQQLPGNGIIEPAGKIGYFPGKTGGIDALDLATGKLLWTSMEANKPLLARDDRLYAQAPVAGKANQIRVVVFDGPTGKTLVTSEPIKLPEWATADWLIGGASGHSFRVAGYLGGDKLLLVWEARTWYAGGARPSPEIEKAARKNADGVVAVNIQSGKVEAPDNQKHVVAVTGKFPADAPQVTRDGRSYSFQDQPIKGRPFQQQRFVQATDVTGAVLWRHEIKAPVILPPRP